MKIRLLLASGLAIYIPVPCIANLYSTIGYLLKSSVKYLGAAENKIKNISGKVSSGISQKFFGCNVATFRTPPEKLQDSKATAEGYKAKHNDYCDELTIRIRYPESWRDKFNKNPIHPARPAKKKITGPEQEISDTNAAEAAYLKSENKAGIILRILYRLIMTGPGGTKYRFRTDSPNLHDNREISRNPSGHLNNTVPIQGDINPDIIPCTWLLSGVETSATGNIGF